jgi:uncharacterized protein (TIGR00369 family)
MSKHPPGGGSFAVLLDVSVVREPPEGGLELAMVVDERHENFHGVTHGGVLMSLLDMAMGGAVRRTLAAEEGCASITINTDFLRAAPKGRITARGKVDRRGATMAFASGELVDAEGKVCARATGIWAIRPNARSGATPPG